MRYAIVFKDHSVWDGKSGFDHKPYDWHTFLSELNLMIKRGETAKGIALVMRDGKVLFEGGDKITELATRYAAHLELLRETAESQARDTYPEPQPVVEGGYSDAVRAVTPTKP